MSNGNGDYDYLVDDPSLDSPVESGDIILDDGNQDPAVTVASQSWLDQVGKLANIAGGTVSGILNSQKYGVPYSAGGGRPGGITYGRGTAGGTLSLGGGSSTTMLLLLLLFFLLFGKKLLN